MVFVEELVSAHFHNVHRFTAESDHAFIFNIHVMDTNPENPNPARRVYVDPFGEKVAGGLIKPRSSLTAR